MHRRGGQVRLPGRFLRHRFRRPGRDEDRACGNRFTGARFGPTGRGQRSGSQGSAERNAAWFAVPICGPISEIGIFQAASPNPDAFGEEDGRLLAILLEHTAVAVSRLRLQEELVRQARHDALTCVFNRHYFNALIAQEVLRASRYNHPIGLFMIDVDHFKAINDRCGHQAGDMVLKEIADVLRDTVCATDMIVRYGGDESLVVLTETGEDADHAAVRIRDAVHNNSKLRAISDFDVSVSAESIFWHPDADDSIEHALAKADERTYDDKRRRS